MRSHLAIGLTLILLLVIAGQAAAAPTVTGFNIPEVDGNDGESFEIRFEIRSDEDTNYTIKIKPRAEFSWPNGNELTKDIPANDTRTYIFAGKLAKALAEDGKYAIQWEAYKNGTLFKSGQVDLRVGAQAPATGGVVALGVMGLVASLMAIVKRRA